MGKLTLGLSFLPGLRALRALGLGIKLMVKSNTIGAYGPYSLGICLVLGEFSPGGEILPMPGGNSNISGRIPNNSGKIT